jgi:hypothetical protein
MQTSTITTGSTSESTMQATVGNPPARRGLGDISPRLAGLGAITFVATVLAQNVVRGASAPANDASPSEVLTHYADHRGVTVALVAMFVLSGTALAVFLGGSMRRLLTTDRRGWALTGFVGGVGILATFSMLVGCEEALTVLAGRDQPDVGAIDALWALHNSVFTVLFLFLAVALLGLSRAGIAAGVTPRAFGRIAPIASALLLIAAVSGPSIAAGDAMPLFGLGAIGFLTWLTFLVTTGRRLVVSERAS